MKPTAEDLNDYVLELLPADEQKRIARAIANDAQLAAEVAALRETLGAIGLSAPLRGSSAAPTSSGRARLLSALDGGSRFSPFVADLALCFDLSALAVRALCERIDDKAAWEQSTIPGLDLLHFTAGPNAIAHDTGFVRFAPGLRFPYHRHLGHEINYVLEGAMIDGDGTVYLPGEAIRMAPDTAHEYAIPESGALIAVVQAGFEVIEKPGG